MPIGKDNYAFTTTYSFSSYNFCRDIIFAHFGLFTFIQNKELIKDYTCL